MSEVHLSDAHRDLYERTRELAAGSLRPTVFARTSEGSRGLSAFAVPGDSEGLSGEHKELLAPHPIGLLRFDAVPVAREQVLGELGTGFRVAMRTLDLFRPSVGAGALGVARAAIEQTLTWTVVVTGGAKGIGRAIVEQFVAGGDDVFLASPAAATINGQTTVIDGGGIQP